MTIQKEEEVIDFVMTQLNTLSKLDTVKYQGFDDADPEVRQYGAVVYIGEDEPVEAEHRHIGPLLTEIWTINVDVIIKRKSKTPRKSVSDDFGTSYWADQLRVLFLNKTNSGAFTRTHWEYVEKEEVNSGIKVKGLVKIELLNKYT